ncbi:uncharacterized protein L199_001586 [Kwoniella botswanensis]|uniref:uncharacterized protein n=1 Tax=Kwoniella botswanensis TaxID=1268659 RepID=UPI00315D9F80
MPQQTSIWQHSRAYVLALAAFMGIFMFGYDTGLGGGLIVLPSFLRDFDMLDLDAEALANRKGNVVSILQGGCLAGALLAAPLTDRIGRQKCLIVNCFAFLLGASLMTASPGNLENVPKHIRGRITGLFQVIVASYWITYGVQFMKPTSAQWRIPVGFQLVPTSIDDEETRAEFEEIVASVAEEEAVTGGRIKGASTSLLASGIYGIVKIDATAIFIFFGIKRFGRRRSLTIGLGLMSLFLWIIGAIFNTHPPDANAAKPSGASIGMAACIYLFVIPYCFAVGPVPWVNSSATQWLWNLIVSRFTPNIVLSLKHAGVFFFFASINIFATIAAFFLPETKGLALEDMDVLFGLIDADQRRADLARAEAGRSIEKDDDLLDEKPGDTKIERV